MATSGSGLPSAKEPKEDQVGVSATVGGSPPADGRDMGATTAATEQPGREERRRREEEPFNSGARPTGRS